MMMAQIQPSERSVPRNPILLDADKCSNNSGSPLATSDRPHTVLIAAFSEAAGCASPAESLTK